MKKNEIVRLWHNVVLDIRFVENHLTVSSIQTCKFFVFGHILLLPARIIIKLCPTARRRKISENSQFGLNKRQLTVR